jgi:natural resistance-associated macrophage protein
VPTLEVLEGFVTPRVSPAVVPQAVALIGSLIMPHNIYLHSALVQTRRLAQDTKGHRQEALMYYGLESGVSLLVRARGGGGRGGGGGVQRLLG